MPGPGAYDVHSRLTEPASKPHVSKVGRAGLRASEVPGPGAYQDEAAFKRISSPAGGVRFGAGRPEGKPSPVPGPGAYDPALQPSSSKQPSVKFGREPRDRAAKSEIPGPGAYEQNLKYPGSAAKFSFGKAAREQPVKNETPDFYDIPHSIPNVPKYNYPEPAKRKIHL